MSCSAGDLNSGPQCGAKRSSLTEVTLQSLHVHFKNKMHSIFNQLLRWAVFKLIGRISALESISCQKSYFSLVSSSLCPHHGMCHTVSICEEYAVNLSLFLTLISFLSYSIFFLPASRVTHVPALISLLRNFKSDGF